jgi:two-component system response regulator AlgR
MDLLIVDDESLARQRLVRMAEKLEDCHVVGEADSAESALIAISQHDPDVVLLDVRMPGEDGLSLAHRIAQLEHAPAIIFCTAFDQYALEAFGTEAVGYLLKPVKAEQLTEVLAKAQRLNKLQRAAISEQRPARASTQRTHITAKTRRGVELIPIDDVRYFIADHKYVTVFHLGGEHLLDETLKELEEEFASHFLRIHRNALISVAHIEAIERSSQGQYQVRLANTEHKPIVSRRHAGNLKSLLKNL